jgi:hypothetical protein
MNFIQKIFLGRSDETVHTQFIRFSVGDYYPRAVMKIKTGSTAKVVSGFEYGNDFVRFIADNVLGEITVKGKIYAKKDFTSQFTESKEKKKGFFIGTIDKKIQAPQLSKLLGEFDADTYFLLNINGNDFDLKISQSPHNPKGSYKDNFCKFSLSRELAKKAIKEYAFDIDKEFKEASIKHRFLIDNVEVPKEFEKDLALARIMAKRVGKVIRELNYDGKDEKKEGKLNA